MSETSTKKDFYLFWPWSNSWWNHVWLCFSSDEKVYSAKFSSFFGVIPCQCTASLVTLWRTLIKKYFHSAFMLKVEHFSRIPRLTASHIRMSCSIFFIRRAALESPEMRFPEKWSLFFPVRGQTFRFRKKNNGKSQWPFKTYNKIYTI